MSSAQLRFRSPIPSFLRPSRVLGIAFIGSLFITSISHGQDGTAVWTNLYSGLGNRLDQPSALAVNGNDKLVVAGYSTSTNDNRDFLTIAYSTAGAALWTNRYNGPKNADDGATAVALDSSGNAFVTGYSVGIGTSTDFVTIKYSSTGQPLWTNRYNGPGNGEDSPIALAVNGSDNVFVTGSAYVTNSYYYDEFSHRYVTNLYTDYATVAYSNTGVPLWTNRYSGPGQLHGEPDQSADYPRGIAVGKDDSVFVTGSSTDSNNDWGYATIAYTGEGQGVWTNRFGGGLAAAIAVDGDGNVLVTGTVGYNYATLKYSGDGVTLWTNYYDSFGSWYSYDDFAQALAVDSSGNVFVAGSHTDEFGSGVYAIVGYTSEGFGLWSSDHSVGSQLSLQVETVAIAVNNSGSVIVMLPQYLPNSFTASFGYVTVAYSRSGAVVWKQIYDPSMGSDKPMAIGLDDQGNVYVTGWITSSTTSYDWATIKYAKIDPKIPVEFKPTGGQLVLTWTDPLFVLQASPEPDGIFTNIPSAKSPFTNDFAGEQMFFRLFQIE